MKLYVSSDVQLRNTQFIGLYSLCSFKCGHDYRWYTTLVRGNVPHCLCDVDVH